jgi:7 transmembrane sweet-taste receptor of 3 GCPR
VLTPFAVMMGLNVAFLVTWTTVDPLYWERVPTGRNGDGQLTSVGRCTSSGKVSLAMLGLILAVNLAAILLACVKAFQTRHLKVAFHESIFLGLGVGSMLQAAAVGLPVLFLVNENPVSIYLVRTGMVFVTCAALIGFIFLPKIILSTKVDNARMRSVVASSSRRRMKAPSSLMHSSNFSKDFSKDLSKDVDFAHQPPVHGRRTENGALQSLEEAPSIEDFPMTDVESSGQDHQVQGDV